MTRGLRSTLLLLAVLLGLVAYVYFVESKRPTSEEAANAKAKVFDLTADQISTLEVTSSDGERAVLEKTDGTWKLTAPIQAAVDDVEVSGVTRALASLEIERIVEEQAPDLAAFGLETPRFEVGFKMVDSDTLTRLRIGDKTATGGDLYARIGDEPKVFLIAGYLDGTFDKAPFEFRDKSILSFERDSVDHVALSAGATSIEATKSGTQWTLERPWAARADSPTLESLLTRIQTARMRSIVNESIEPGELSAFGLDEPVATIMFGTGSAQATLAVGGATEDGNRYARDLSRSMVFTVDASLLTELQKEQEDWRQKDLFDFRSYNATRVAITRNGATMAFEKRKAPDEGTELIWRRVEPSEADVDADKFRTLLSALSGLRAETFVDPSTATGTDSPVLTVAVQFDDGKRDETVQFGSVGDAVYGLSSSDKSPVALDGERYGEAVAAIDAISGE